MLMRKGLNNFIFGTFIGDFRAASMGVKGLNAFGVALMFFLRRVFFFFFLMTETESLAELPCEG